MTDGALLDLIRARVRAGGPITIGTYMELALSHPKHGYYRRHVPILGAEGDFITAPEISQVFGELIGLWVAVVWRQMGKPAAFDLIELGPGRGTLMADAMRAMRIVPGVLDAARLVLVDQNEALRAEQHERLSASKLPLLQIEEMPELQRPAILVANEFLDALPVEQLEWTADGWRERLVEVLPSGELGLKFGRVAVLKSDRLPKPPPQPGDVLEDRPAARAILAAQAASRFPVAALFIDYGHTGPAYGDTLQAVRRHCFEPIFKSPGNADLSAHVDFGALARDGQRLGLAVSGPVPQARFLGELGIVERAQRLMRSADPNAALAIEQAIARLIDPSGMGTRFQVIGLASDGMQPLPGFAALHQ